MNDFDRYYLYKLKNRYNMASITDHVIKLQELTQKNLEILQALNDSFFTNQNHLSVMVGGNHYAIPSFISLENKINSLAANFENLVNAPETGEAFFDFNGNSRAIQVRTYTSTPNSLVLDPVSDFHIDNNDIFKDFLTPNPYINLNVQTLPNDTTQVLVKKIIPLNAELKHLFTSKLTEIDGDAVIHKTSIKYPYKDLYKVLDSYVQDVDYIEYDSKVDLPVRKNVGSGTYVIEEILEDVVDENLDNFITIKLRNDVDDPTIMSSLKYRLFDETIEKMLKVGDELVTYEGNAKLMITEIRSNTNTIKVKVLHGEFLNFVPATTNNVLHISPLSKIKFYSPIDFDEDKYVRVPLEEDQYIFVAVAALNSRMNIQSAWGSGLMLNTYVLLNNNKDFKTYYDENVRNVGDVLFEITAMMSNTLTKYSKEEYDEFSQCVPQINTNNLQVVRINSHLNDSIAVKNIRALYSQKLELQNLLEEINNNITDNNNILTTISFDDTTGQRAAYTEAIAKLNVDKNNTLTSLSKIMNEISMAANNSELPIENAKYRIRGFFDTADVENNPIFEKWGEHIKGIRVQYRYKNVDSEQNHALTIGDKFVYSDWNEMESNDRVRVPKYENGIYKSMLEPKNDKINEPSFNQIDIPISQGETIDIRLKVVYDFGAPFVETTSKWSPIVNIGFPQEFLKDIKILDIIEENNNDIESNHFSNIIKEEGIPEHISDKIKDQDITYFHKPENIASGFYTAERRIIPLKDKLTELTNLVTQLQDEVMGTQTDQLTVSIKQGNRENKLTSFSDNYIYTEAYKNLSQSTGEGNNSNAVGNYEFDGKKATTIFYISLKNDSQRSCKLYSLFPNTYQELHTIKNSKYDKNDYILTSEVTPLYVLGSDPNADRSVRNNYIQNIGGVWMEYQSSSEDAATLQDKSVSQKSHLWMTNPLQAVNNHTLQTGNQFIYFRTRDILTQERLYGFNQVLNVKLGTFDSDEYDPSEMIAAKTGKKQLKTTAQITYTSLNIDPDTENILSGGARINIQNAKEEWVYTLDNILNNSLWSGIIKDTLTKDDNIIYADELEGLTGALYKHMGEYHNIKYADRNAGDHDYDSKFKSFMYVYPKLNQKNGLQIQNSNYLTLNPNDEILIPIVVEYNVKEKQPKIQKSISFDILTSLYKDPTNYKVTFVSKFEHTDQDKIMIAQQTEYNTNTSKYNVIYK